MLRKCYQCYVKVKPKGHNPRVLRRSDTKVTGARGGAAYLGPMDFQSPEDFVNGQVLLVDKPAGWTSFDVVNKLRNTLVGGLGLRKIKVGHAGTLDPLATGVLVVCTGAMTKRIDSLLQADKRYHATVRLGAHTPSGDAETDVDAWGAPEACARLDAAAVAAAAAQFTGAILQVPPVFSAKKVDGRRAYEVARAGGELALPPVPVTVHRFEVLSAVPTTVEGHAVLDADVDILCSKGTYIRSLARDLGAALGVGGTLTALRRTASGNLHEADCLPLDALVARIRELGQRGA